MYIWLRGLRTGYFIHFIYDHLLPYESVESRYAELESSNGIVAPVNVDMETGEILTHSI
ncbi:hypothetical protein [Solibacillus cecembensis]|uniref:hypothetical protein n=1 Tax=Solibacillus cecembensis TaxID=459347 RepID=UPI003D043CC4